MSANSKTDKSTGSERPWEKADWYAVGTLWSAHGPELFHSPRFAETLNSYQTTMPAPGGSEELLIQETVANQKYGWRRIYGWTAWKDSFPVGFLYAQEIREEDLTGKTPYDYVRECSEGIYDHVYDHESLVKVARQDPMIGEPEEWANNQVVRFSSQMKEYVDHGRRPFVNYTRTYQPDKKGIAAFEERFPKRHPYSKYKEESWRGVGLGSALYRHVGERYAEQGRALFGSGDQSDGALAVWARLIKDGLPVGLVDSKNYEGDIVPVLDYGHFYRDEYLSWNEAVSAHYGGSKYRLSQLALKVGGPIGVAVDAEQKGRKR